MDSHFPRQPERVSGPRPLPEPGLGIAVINEWEGLGDGFYKLPLLRALKRAYPAEKITWVVSEATALIALPWPRSWGPISRGSWSTRICAGQPRERSLACV